MTDVELIDQPGLSSDMMNEAADWARWSANTLRAASPISGGINFGSNLSQSYNNALQMLYNAKEAEKQRAYEKMMSDTAYQRAVGDLKAAGINPLYLFGSGGNAASTPSGSAASANLSTAANSKGLMGQLAMVVIALAKLLALK